MASKGQLKVRVVGDDSHLRSTLKGAGGLLGKFAIGAGAAVAGLAAAGLKSFADLQSGMNEVFTLLPGISQGAMDDMTAQVKQFSKDFGVLPNDVVPALYQSLSAGVPSDNVFSFLETANKAALGGVTDLETAVDGITSVTNAYGDQISGAAEASDLMFTAVRLGKTNFEELAGSLFNVLPTASALGVGFDNITAAMASMTSQGTPTSVATTQMRQLLVELSKEGGAAADTFKEMAGKTFKAFIAEGGNVADALDLMQKAAGNNDVAINDLFGSVEAGNAALALSGDNADAFRANLDEMAGAAGATEAAYDQMDQGLGRAFDRIKAQGAVLLVEIGEKLAPTVQMLADKFQEWMPAIQRVVEGAFDVIGQLITNVVVPALTALGDWWSEHGPGIVQRAQEIAAVVRDVVVAAVQTLADWWSANGPAIVDAVQRVADVVGGALMAGFEALSSWWSANGPAIMSFASNLADGVGDAFEKLAGAAEWVRDNWNTIKPVLMTIGGVIAGLLIPHYIALGVQAVISAGKNVAAWVMKSTAAVRHGAVIIASILKVMAQGAVWVATHVAQAGVFVAKWAFMGVKSLLHAAKVAAAWLIAMGPIALVIAAVVGLAVLIVKNWDKIREFTVKAWEKISTAVSDAIGKVVDWFKELPGRLLSAISSFATTVASFIVQYHPVAILYRKVREVWPTVLAWLKELPGRIVSGISGFASTVFNFIAQNHPVAILLRKLREAWPTLSGWLRELPGRIVSAIGNLGSKLRDAGGQLIQGLIRGMTDKVRAAVDAVKNAVGSVISGAKSFLGIRSPSRLAAKEIGEPFAEGIVGGVADTLAREARTMSRQMLDLLDVPKVDMRTLRDASTPSPAGLAADMSGARSVSPAMLSGTPGGSGTVVVNVPNYVGDKRELAAVIRRELANVQRANGTTGLQ